MTEKFVNVDLPSGTKTRYACPCCGHLTLFCRGGFEICPICYWEDDGQDDHDADRARGGPNLGSLTEARQNFRDLGAYDLVCIGEVRPPTADEALSHPTRLQQMTLYFQEQVLRKRPYLKVEWCVDTVARPVKREVQEDDRVRFWSYPTGRGGKALRVVTLEDRHTLHNAFPGSGMPRRIL